MMDKAAALGRASWRRARFALGRHLRRRAEGQFQPYNHTLPDRYPWLFDFAAAKLWDMAAPRLLSFGCSIGEEVFSLRRRLPAAAIKGIDIDPANIAACLTRASRANDVQMAFEVGSSAQHERRDHYDAVFCLAMLCHGDLTVSGARRSKPLMRFRDFEQTVTDLARCVKPRGLLFLHTTNFRFCDTTAAQGFDVVLEARPDQMAPDLLYDREGRLMSGKLYLPVGFRKRTSPT
jgi:2-polyprenyl-3-methyl-5-hydroxy-6-metoxy-1,4-benzoquinol methylase